MVREGMYIKTRIYNTWSFVYSVQINCSWFVKLSSLRVYFRINSRYQKRNNVYMTLLNCKSKNLIYLIDCKKCGKQYIGETKRHLHQRTNP